MLDINLTNIFNLANVDAQKVLDSLDDDDNDSQFSSTDSRKRKRLDDFTPQERIVRRKLKNRVAAQTARDRKKERMATLEQIVSRLELENSELKKSNNELRTNMDYLMSQNKELRMKLGMEDTITPEHNYTRKVTALPDPKHIIIKEEEEELKTEHASLRVSLPQKLQVLLISLIMTWLANPRLSNHLSLLEKSHQQRVLKKMLQHKLQSKLNERSQKMNKTVQTILAADLRPLLEICRQKMQMKCLNSVRTSSLWCKKETIL